MCKFNNIHEFADALFCIPREYQYDLNVVDRCSDRLFKNSRHGLGIQAVGMDGKRVTTTDRVCWGIKVTGIVEGTDIESTSIPLMFPFEGDDFWKMCTLVSWQLDDAEAEWYAQGE
jgi:hypothetical protein